MNESKMNLTPAENQQYSRHLLLEEVGVSGQLRLKQSKVLIIGAGGLGCPVLQYLSAAGVGKIGIVDDDAIEQSNLHRQILYTQEDIGKNKAETAAKTLQRSNPFIQFDIYKTRLTKDNALALLEPYDIIVDGSDNFPTRYLINDAAVLMDKPVVFGSIYKFSGQVAVFNFKNGPTYRCLYPTPPAPHEVLNCSDVGVLGVLPGIIGSFQANEVLKLIIGFGNVLSGKLLTFNALSMNQSIFSFDKNPAITITSLEANYQMLCGIHEAVKEISFQEYKKQSLSFNTLDVRTQDERDEFHILSIHIPLDELSKRYHELPGDKKLLIYCKSGSRSKIAIDILKNKDFKNELFNLKGGLLSQKAQI